MLSLLLNSYACYAGYAYGFKYCVALRKWLSDFLQVYYLKLSFNVRQYFFREKLSMITYCLHMAPCGGVSDVSKANKNQSSVSANR